MKDKEGGLITRKFTRKFKRWRVIISRLLKEIDQKLRAAKAGYRSGKVPLNRYSCCAILSNASLSGIHGSDYVL